MSDRKSQIMLSLVLDSKNGWIKCLFLDSYEDLFCLITIIDASCDLLFTINLFCALLIPASQMPLHKQFALLEAASSSELWCTKWSGLLDVFQGSL